MTAHSEVGGSVCTRFIACPGSVRLSRGIPNTTSPAAEEGTKAHNLAEINLKGLLGEPRKNPVMFTEEYTPEASDREAIASYVDFAAGMYREMKKLDDGAVYGIEDRCEMSTIHPAMFGTVDFWCYSPAHQHLNVVDFKFGQGVEVFAEGNKQLRFYALGVLLKIARPVRTITLVIHQPRFPSGNKVKEETIKVDELIEFMETLKKAAHVALEGEQPPLSAGEHCKFCPAAGKCPVVQASVKSVSDLIPYKTIEEKLRVLPALKEFIKSTESEMQRLAVKDELPEGYKQVAKRGTRKWIFPKDKAMEKLGAKGVKVGNLLGLPSPAQAEKLMDKEERKVLKELCHMVSSGVTWAAEKSGRSKLTVKEVFKNVDLEYKGDK